MESKLNQNNVPAKHAGKIVLFQSKRIRRIWHRSEWFYSVVDIVEALSESPTPRQYWGKIKQREFIDLQLSPIWVQLKLMCRYGIILLTAF